MKEGKRLTSQRTKAMDEYALVFMRHALAAVSNGHTSSIVPGIEIGDLAHEVKVLDLRVKETFDRAQELAAQIKAIEKAMQEIKGA